MTHAFLQHPTSKVLNILAQVFIAAGVILLVRLSIFIIEHSYSLLEDD
jgi:hypothetical protein